MAFFILDLRTQTDLRIFLEIFCLCQLKPSSQRLRASAATLVLSSAALVPAQVAYAFDLSGSSARARLPNFVDFVEKVRQGRSEYLHSTPSPRY